MVAFTPLKFCFILREMGVFRILFYFSSHKKCYCLPYGVTHSTYSRAQRQTSAYPRVVREIIS